MSAVTPRLPCTISLIRRGGTPIDTANLFWVIQKPSMKSSRRISPGWIGAIFSVAVNDLHLLWSGVGPHESNPNRSLILRDLRAGTWESVEALALLASETRDTTMLAQAQQAAKELKGQGTWSAVRALTFLAQAERLLG